MKIPDDLRSAIEIVNDLNNFVPVGVVFIVGWPGLPAAGIDSNPSDPNWKWLDCPFTEIPGASPLIESLILLVRKAYCRLSYKIFDKVQGIAVVRIYLFPEDSPHIELIKNYRDRYFRFKRSIQWLEKQSLIGLQNLLTVTDFNPKLFHISTSKELLQYMSSNPVLLIPFFSTGPKLTFIDESQLDFHLGRLGNKKSFQLQKNISNRSNMQSRLTDIYDQIESPKSSRLDIKDPEVLQMFDAIQNEELVGFKSKLYNFQKRSLMKMIERENSNSLNFMPHILKLKNNTYFNMKSMLPVLDPPTYMPPRGGILAENMGLGKTCICLALICLSKFEISEFPNCQTTVQNKSKMTTSLLDYCVESIVQNSISWKEYIDDFPVSIVHKLEKKVGYFDKIELPTKTRKTRGSEKDDESFYKRFYLVSTTLVVLPDNLFYQWRVEINKHVEKDYLNVLEIQTFQKMKALQHMSFYDIAKKDVVLISNSVFSKQFEEEESFLKCIYWKRIIVDEGHTMQSKTSRAVLLTKNLLYERMWVISGTPTSGLTNLHIENDSQEYNVQKSFHPKQDLERLGLMVSNFFKIQPWASSRKLWTETIVKPFENNEHNIELQLKFFLSQLIVRHNIKDVEDDISLPPLHHKPVFLKPSFYHRMTINLFISVLATNAITSRREGTDYMFDPSNKSDLRRLVTNLQKGTFYWTSFSIKDIENLLNFSVFSLREQDYSEEDKDTLKKAIYYSKLALSNMRWRAVSAVHEMAYFVENLPKPIVENYSLVAYDDTTAGYGYPHLMSLQKFFYRNRLVVSEEHLKEKIEKSSKVFWNGYWKSIKSSHRPLSNKEDVKNFKISDVKQISEVPEWVHTFNPMFEEGLAYGENLTRRSRTPKTKDNDSVDVSFQMRNAKIVGTLSRKLNYLSMRLLENQIQGIKSIVFYEFENSAYYLTELLDILGMNYIMYAPYIKAADRSNNVAQFDSWDCSKNEGEGVCLIMDLKLASHGLTIIAATHVFFINPVWNQAIEAQAIKRAHRIGQLNEVFVETLILENTLEEQMYNMRNETKDINDMELIDHTKIRDYILTFPFLRMFVNGAFTEEYCTFETPLIDLRETLRPFDDGVVLDVIHSEVHANSNTRVWKLPLFTKKNLDKLLSSEATLPKRRYDNINGSVNDRMNGEKSDDYKRAKVMEKLRNKRRNKVRFNI